MTSVLPPVDLLICSFSCTFDPHRLFLSAAIFIPPSSSLISPSLLLFLTSCLPNLFSRFVHTSSQPVSLFCVCLPTLSLVLALPLSFGLSLSPSSTLRCLCTCPSAAHRPSIHQSVTAQIRMPATKQLPWQRCKQWHLQNLECCPNKVVPLPAHLIGGVHTATKVPSGRCQWHSGLSSGQHNVHRYQARLTVQYKPVQRLPTDMLRDETH